MSQRSHWRPIVVPLGPVQAPPLAVSFAPTTAEPEIVGAEVTSTAAACAGAARPSASTGPSNAMLIAASEQLAASVRVRPCADMLT